PVLRHFVEELATGKTFIEAWQRVRDVDNKYKDRWVAICHREAAGDKPADIAQNHLKEPAGFDLIRFDPKHNSTKVPLFRQMYSACWFKKGLVSWDTKENAENRLHEGDAVEIAVFKAFKPGDEITITVVCRRIDSPQRYDIRTMFELTDTLGAPLRSIKTARRLTAPRRPPLPADEVEKDTGHDSWIIPVAQETDRVKL